MPAGEALPRATGQGASAGSGPKAEDRGASSVAGDLDTVDHWSSAGNHVRAIRHELPADGIGQRLYAVWHRDRDRLGDVPFWIDIEALDVPEAISGSILALPERDQTGQPPRRFVAGFVGKEVQRIWGEDFTGQIMHSDVFPEITAAISAGLWDAMTLKRPVAVEFRVQIAFRIGYLYGTFLPFRAPAGDRGRVLAHFNFSNITIRNAQDWRGSLENQERIQRLLAADRSE